MKRSSVVLLLFVVAACGQRLEVSRDHRQAAERFFRGVYEGDLSVVDELAGEEIVASYPIFTQLFNAPALRGRAAYKRHASNFGQTWADGTVTIHESVAEGERVVLVWSFRARPRTPASGAEAMPYANWGGITVLRFDQAGMIVEEVGEESEPGPMARLHAR